MATEYLPPRDCFRGASINGWTLEEEVGRGKIGVVYRGIQRIGSDVDHLAAIKIIPNENLKDDWQTEIRKAVKLTGIPEVVQYKGHQAALLDGKAYGCVFWEYIKGQNLRSYVETSGPNVTLTFIESLLRTVLRVLVATDATRITHGDLHEGNILIADPDDRFYDTFPSVPISMRQNSRP